uniref:hypothetical protein n=1 Tax=Phocaeicola plebeius TaxID=310297 RepID=UPI0026F10951
STVPVYKKKKRLVISGKVTLLFKASTPLGVLQYCHGSTGVLQGEDCSTAKEVLKEGACG